MKRYLVLALAAPGLALDVKYGGMFRVRWEANNNVTGGQDKKAGLYDDDQCSA